MAGASIVHWSWCSRPDITIKDGVLIDGKSEQGEWYRPGEHINSILTAIQLVEDEETAERFVNDWGMLGLEYDGNRRRGYMFWGAVDFTFGTRGGTLEDRQKIAEEVLEYYGVKDLIDFTQPRETAQDIVDFASRIRNISKIKLLLSLYQDDPYAAEYEAEAWLNGLAREEFQEAIGIGADIDFLETEHRRGFKAPFWKYVLELGLSNHRNRFSGFLQKSIWIELYRSHREGVSEGFPVICFEGLFRFIEYVLLGDPAPLPQRCADPKCRQLFFPNREGQVYCPPPPGVKRSRCEQRHNKEKKRAALKNAAANVANMLPRELNQT